MGGQQSRRTSSNENPSLASQASPYPAQRSAVVPNARNTYPGHRAGATAQSLNSAPINNNNPPAARLPTAGQFAHSAPASTTTTTTQQTAATSRSQPSTGTNTIVRGTPPDPSGNRAQPAATPSDVTTRPGAYQVTRTTTGPAIVYRVSIPNGVAPGSEFHVHAGDRRVRVRCPPTSRPGQSLQITLPPAPQTQQTILKIAPLTAAPEVEAGGGAVSMTPEVRRVNQQAEENGGSAQSFLVDIPPNVYPGMTFTVNVAGQRFMVTCPPNAGPNMKIRIVPPTVREEPQAAPKTQVFEVAVPAGVSPGQPFTLVANGQRVLVTCPPNVSPGQKIRFQLPVSQVVGNIQLSYESNVGWRRIIRVTDMKFQWVRLENKEDEPENGGVDVAGMETFDFGHSAYVRKLTFLEGNDARMRSGRVSLIPAKEAVVDSRLVVRNRTLLSYADIAEQQGKGLEEKTAWLQNICLQLTSAWEDGHIKIAVRRKYLLLDSVDCVMSLGRDDLRKRWRIEFLGEPAIDAGGVSREWFQLVTEQVFDPAFGLFVSSVNNQMAMSINPASGISCPDDHLVYFRFLGRVIGRALFDRQLIKGHMVRSLYKHLLGWPITFDDIKDQDEEYYQSLKKLTKMDDISIMCLDFTVTEESMGVRYEVELVEGGALKEVTKDNLQEYLEANLCYRMLERTKPQLTELLLGFFDIIPEPALTVLDANELELILCGLPEIDLEDWKTHTNYSGIFETKGGSHQVVRWFWEVVRDNFDQEMKARLLQFVTGTSGVPPRGFSVLQGIDGNIKKFTIHGVDRKVYQLPRAHTCFNRIDLPDYYSKDELLENLKKAVTMSGFGFGLE
ncbi:hypothetical protein ACA910_022316 [Epithemia clementina (nom. ined.)]